MHFERFTKRETVAIVAVVLLVLIVRFWVIEHFNLWRAWQLW